MSITDYQSFRPIYTVSKLTADIKNLLERSFAYIWVEGEVSNLRTPGSGHLYFTLKDESAQVRAVMFRMQARMLKFDPRDGRQVICFGRLSVYEPRGEYQMVIEYMEPKGLGALQLAFEQLKEKLAREGLFDPAHKRPLPRLPQKIGIVTSPSGAAVRDILHIIERRYANVHILIYPVRVQGPGAAPEIVQAIRHFNAVPGIEVIIVARGGGSLEDLWAFNEEAVARAIFDSGIPVISAVGHEVDFTIADFVADLRAPTPSAAAELAVRNKIELAESVQNLERRLAAAAQAVFRPRREKLSSLIHRLADPRRKLSDFHLRLDNLEYRLTGCLRQILSQKRERLGMKEDSLYLLHPRRQFAEHYHRLAHQFRRIYVSMQNRLHSLRQKTDAGQGRLGSLNPLAVLERGYSIARLLPEGKVIFRSASLKPSDTVSVKVHEGEFVARVEEIKE